METEGEVTGMILSLRASLVQVHLSVKMQAVQEDASPQDSRISNARLPCLAWQVSTPGAPQSPLSPCQEHSPP